MPILKAADDDALLAAERTPDCDLIAFAQRAMRFGGLSVHRDLAALAGLLRFRSRSEETRDIEPDVQPNVFEGAHVCNSRTHRKFCYLTGTNLIRFQKLLVHGPVEAGHYVVLGPAEAGHYV